MRPYPVIDGHAHLYSPEALDILRAYRRDANLKAIALASICCIGNGHEASQNLLALIFKREEPAFYAFGSLMYGANLPDFRAQAEALIADGFDGVKLLESKPGYRKKLGFGMDDARYEGFFAYLEEAGIPVLWHVADPETFWDDRAPKFAVDAGWVYTDGTFPSKESLCDAACAVLTRHPNLQAIFAHFFFLSASVEAAEAFMRRFPNACLDVTPGIEMYENFSLDMEAWRAFFLRYADRIVLGTDVEEDADSPAQTMENILRFLSTRDAFTFWHSPVRGLGLPEDVVRKICHDNFIRKMGACPKPVDAKALAARIDRELPLVGRENCRAYIEAYRKGL